MSFWALFMYTNLKHKNKYWYSPQGSKSWVEAGLGLFVQGAAPNSEVNGWMNYNYIGTLRQYNAKHRVISCKKVRKIQA